MSRDPNSETSSFHRRALSVPKHCMKILNSLSTGQHKVGLCEKYPKLELLKEANKSLFFWNHHVSSFSIWHCKNDTFSNKSLQNGAINTFYALSIPTGITTFSRFLMQTKNNQIPNISNHLQLLQQIGTKQVRCNNREDLWPLQRKR